MAELDDHQLLTQFAHWQSEPAFAALIARYVNLVHSVAWRQTGDAYAAEEITQAVFIILARKAGSLGGQISLSGWLHQTARLTAANYRRAEIRRAHREQEAFMQSQLDEVHPDPDAAWRQVAPLLDDALGRLGDRDRHALVLRFFEGKALAEVGVALGASEDAAKMRVNRALEKLRKIFTKRGVTLSATAIASVVVTNSVQAAPIGLAKTISVVALTKGAAASGSTETYGMDKNKNGGGRGRKRVARGGNGDGGGESRHAPETFRDGFVVAGQSKILGAEQRRAEPAAISLCFAPHKISTRRRRHDQHGQARHRRESRAGGVAGRRLRFQHSADGVQYGVAGR
jgi:RNA polymerase sigma factor (sigma-70 family)